MKESEDPAVMKMPNEPPTEPMKVKTRSRLGLERERRNLSDKYPAFTIVGQPYHREADDSDYWVLIAPIRIGWFKPGNREIDRMEVQTVWQRESKNKPVLRHGEECWAPMEKP
jgi:hypothetical protein